MKNKLLLGALMILMTISCRDNSLLPLDYHQGQNLNGAYLRTIDIPSTKLNLLDFSNSYYEIIYEAGVPDISKFESVSLTIQFIDNTKSNGVFKRAPQTLPTINASSFAVDATSKLPRYTFKMTGPEIITASTIPLDSVTFGDTFQIVETINYDGKAYSFTNTSADLTGGPYYSSPFLHIVGTGDPLSISMTWDDGKGYCKSIDLDLYFTAANKDVNHPVDGYAAATGNCPEKTQLTLAKPDGDYYGLLNPYDYAVTATDIATTFTFSQPGKASKTIDLVDSNGDKIVIKSTDHVWSASSKDGNFILYTAFKITKTGPNFDIYDGSGTKVATFGL